MKLKETVQAIIGNQNDYKAKVIRTRIALALNFTEFWVGRCIKANKDNGPLTTMAAIEIIREETGLEDSEILEEADQIAA